jgi:uncharacterized membrane protein
MLNNSKWTRRWIAIAVAVGLWCMAEARAGKPAKPPASGTSYKIAKLAAEDESGTWDCYARDINDLRDVVGYVEDAVTGQRRAACWEVSGSGDAIQSQLILLTGGSDARGVNDCGEIVGYGTGGNGQTVGLYWATAAAAPLTLPPLSEDARSYALAINNQGVVCGQSVGATAQAVAWRVDWAGGQPSVSPPRALPTLDEASSALAIGNNDADGVAQVVGRFAAASGQSTAAVAWTVASRPDGTLAVDPVRWIVESGDAWALGVNDGGTICGQAGWPTEAMVWTDAASWTLHRARGIELASAQGINPSGVIVGWGDTGQIAREAVAWPRADGSMIQLNKYLGRKSPFVKLVEACAVNDLGEIVGYGFTEVGGASDAVFLAMPA